MSPWLFIAECPCKCQKHLSTHYQYEKNEKTCWLLGPKAIVLSWWAIETCMSPNQKEVVRKILRSHLYEDKLIQHVMETQVIFFFILGFLLLSFYCLFLHLTFFFFSKCFSLFFPFTLDLHV